LRHIRKYTGTVRGYFAPGVDGIPELLKIFVEADLHTAALFFCRVKEFRDTWPGISL
jgi:hypothetical protein